MEEWVLAQKVVSRQVRLQGGRCCPLASTFNPPGMPRLWYRQRQLWQLWRWCRPLPRLLLRSHLPPELVPL